MDPAKLRALQANYTPIDLGGQASMQQAGTQQRPQKKKRNFWLDQISTATGTIGGIAGGILGAGAGGVGAVPGAAAGGAGGAALGEVIENFIDPEAGDKGNVLEEAVLGGVFAGGPLKLGKVGLQAGAKAVGKKAAQEGLEATTRTAGERATQSLLGNAWNIKSGSKIGSKVLRPKEAAEIQNFIIKNVGVPKTASADMVFEGVARYSDETGKAISSAVKANTKPVDSFKITQRLQNRFGTLLGVDGTNPTAQSIISRVNQAKTPEDLWKLAKQIDDDLINFRRNPAGADPIIERVGQAARDEIRGTITKLVPETKALNKSYSLARQAEELVSSAANKPRGVNLFNNRIGGGIAQRGQAALGRMGGGVNNFAKSVPTTSAKGIAARQIGQNLIIPRNPQESSGSLEDSLSIEDMLQTQDMSSGQVEEVQQEQSPYTKENMQADIQRDPKNASDYIAYYQSLQEIYGPPEQPKLPNTAVQGITDLQTGLDNLDSLESRIGESSANVPIIGGLRSKNPFDTESKSLRAELDRVKQVVGKALEGGVLRKEDEEKYARILPTINDTDEVARRKIAAIRGDLQNKLQTFYSNSMQFGGGGGGTLEQAVQQPTYR